MKLFGSVVIACGLLIGLVSTSQAEVIEKTILSTDLTPCSRMGGYHDSFGIWWPKVEFARQTFGLTARLEAPLSGDAIAGIFNQCNSISLGIAGGASILAANPGPFAATYKSAFTSCLYAQAGGEAMKIDVKVGSTCHW